MFDAVIFDCDGVLVDSEVLALEVELAALAEIGLTYERSAFAARFMGMSGDGLLRRPRGRQSGATRLSPAARVPRDLP